MLQVTFYGPAIRTPDYGIVDSGLIPSRVKAMTSKLIFTASLIDAKHQRDSVKNKPVSVLERQKALGGIVPS